MSQDNWYRRRTWTELDRTEFDARLKRSRSPGNRAQYLRIQASHLAEVGHYPSAIELLDRMFVEYPAKIHLAEAHLQKAEALLSLGQVEAAIDEFRRALQSERDFPNVRTQAWVNFPWFIVSQELTDLYDEALSILQEFVNESALTFPVTRYRYFVILSFVSQSEGDLAAARDFAKHALGEASKEHSGFRYHPTTGLVGFQPEKVQNKLKLLAGS